MDKTLLYALSITLVSYLFFFGWRYLTRRSPKYSPPSPPKLPVVGNLHQLGHLVHRSLWNLSKRYGPLMLLHLGSKPMLVVSSAEVAKQILKTHDLAFSNKPEMKYPRKIFYDLKDVIHLPYGDQWRKLRSIFVHDLLSNSRVKSFASIREEEVALLVEKIEDCSLNNSVVNLTEMLAELSNNFISRAALGKKHSEMENGKKLLEVVEEAAALLLNFSIGEFVPWLAWIDWFKGMDAAFDKIVEIRDQVFDAIVKDQMESKLENTLECSRSKFDTNIMDILLGIYKGDVAGVSIDLISLKGAIFDIMAAGTETTSTTLVWIMTELMRHPSAMTKLQAEIRGVMKGKHHISDDDLQKMHYLKAVIKETFRLRPVLGLFARTTREPVNVMGYEIAPKTTVFINAWAIGRDPACWDEPEKFMPERFLDSSVDFKGFDFQLIPFGAGRRICPGMGFAIVAIEHTIANLMLKFDWALRNQAKREDLDVTERQGFSIVKKTPLIVVATRNLRA